MSQRKGELSKAAIDRHWPHQVALSHEKLRGQDFTIVQDFCRDLSLCSRGHSFRRDDLDFVVFCFGERADSELFQARFGGEFVDPKTRPKWPGQR